MQRTFCAKFSVYCNALKERLFTNFSANKGCFKTNYVNGHLLGCMSFRRTQKRTQNAMTLMPFLTLLPLKLLQIQAGQGGVAALSHRQQGFKFPWGRHKYLIFDFEKKINSLITYFHRYNKLDDKIGIYLKRFGFGKEMCL